MQGSPSESMVSRQAANDVKREVMRAEEDAEARIGVAEGRTTWRGCRTD